MSEVIQRNNRNILSDLQRYLIEIPQSLFVVLFLLSAGYLLLTKIEAPDLWWHLACGRYFLENGVYPPPGTFTFSPVNPRLTSNAHTWLGDLFLYCIHRFSGGETGLQLFRIIVSCIPVWVFTRFSNNRYNTWTLLGSLTIIMGTYQQNLLRNSIFAMMFLPLMVWLWHIATKSRHPKWLLLYPVILLLWTYMHGYAIVGLCILALFFVGEVIDQCIKKEYRNIRFLIVLLIVLCCSWQIVHVNWNVNPLNIVRNIQATLLQKNALKEPAVETIIKKPEISQKHVQIDDLSDNQFNNIINFAQNLFRPFLKGGDADIVMEYKSPFEVYALLPSRTLFVYCFCYLIYLFFGFIYDRSGFKASYILPSLASLFLGLGYVRTLAFPFLIAFPLMAAHLPAVVTQFREDETRIVDLLRKILPWLGMVIYIGLLVNSLSIIEFTVNPVIFTAIFVFMPMVCIGGLWFLPKEKFQHYFRFNQLIFWLLPLFICTQFALTAHYYYRDKTFYKLTQIFTREPGIGRNSLFRDTLPDYVLKNYPNENILNNYSMGGYLIWKWYNKKKVFIDSRSINYKKDFYDDYNKNFSFRYLDRLGIDKALLNIIRDESRNHIYMSHNWTLLTFDISTILLQRQTETGLKSTYGVIPTFIGKPEDLDLLPKLELHAFAAFINNTLRYMLLFGRLSDAIQWTENIQNIIEKLPLEMQQGILQKKEFMSMLERHFGRINNPVLATACRKMEADSNPVSQKIILGDAHQAFNRKKDAAGMYLAAARLKPGDIALQKKIGELMLQLGFIDQAISQYQAVINLNPDRVDDYIRLAYLFAFKKEYEQSTKFLKKALALEQKQPNIYLNLGLVLSANGDLGEAIDIFKKGLGKFPKNIRLQEELNQLEQQKK